MMNHSTGFWLGVSAGLVAGAAAVSLLPGARMKTPVGRTIQKAGRAVDDCMDNIVREMR